jgi:hypothetical protein
MIIYPYYIPENTIIFTHSCIKYKEMNNINDPLIMFGSIKIMDGLFITDEIAANDLEFISTNKITSIINCSCKQVPNHWS